MICIPIIKGDLKYCLKILKNVDLAEIRFDKVCFKDEEIEMLFSNYNLIATFRPGVDDEIRLATLKKAISSGAKYVDIELESDTCYRNELLNSARKYSCNTIISYHNFLLTPDIEQLNNILEECFVLGADIAKIATMVNSPEDNARLLSLYSNKQRMVILGMGELGTITRIAAPFLGAEFTFASLDKESASAPGQISYKKMLEIYSLIKNLK